MKFIFLSVVVLAGLVLHAQEIPADSASQYSKDTVGLFHKVEIEALYPGGEPAWKKYLEKNFRVNKVAAEVIKQMPKSERRNRFVYTDTVQFIVCKDGSLCEIKSIANVPEPLK